MTLKRFIDLPPIWLIAACGLAWVQARFFDYGLNFGGAAAELLGGLLVGGGVLLMALAIFEMRRMQTTVMPHRDANTLVTTGIFKRSRNPIYLGDVLVMCGLILNWGAVLSLPLIPLFIWIIEKRFIFKEEAGLRRKFKADFARYEQSTRRWV